MKTAFEENRFTRKFGYLETKTNKVIRLEKIKALETKLEELESKEDDTDCGLTLSGIHHQQDVLAERLNALKATIKF